MAEQRRFAALALLAAGLLLPGLLTGPSLDAAVFVHAAGQVRDGGVLYIDVWDHKPPGAVLLLAVLQWALPFLDPWVIAWVLSVVVTALAGWLVARILAALEVQRTATTLVGMAVVVVTGQYLTALGGGLTEPVASALLAAALYVVLRHGGRARLLAAGALASAAVLVSIPAAVGAFIVAAIAVVSAIPRARAAFLVLVGMSVPVAAIGAGLLATGALGPAIDAVIGYSAAYRASNALAGMELSAPVASWTLLALLFVLVPAIIGSISALRPGNPHRWLVAACLAWTALSLALFAYQGRFFAHYAIPLAIPIGILAGLGLDRLATRSSKPRPAARVAQIAPVALGIAISLVASTIAGAMEWTPVARLNDRVRLAAAAIREITQPEDTIWVWGTAPQLYLAADREMATSYGYLYPLVTPGYSTPTMIAATRDELRANPPELIIDAGSSEPGSPGFAPLLIPRPTVSDGRDLDLLDPLRVFVREHYAELAAADGWIIYRLRP